MKKISIIIPAYNVENYIGICLDSLVNQTLQDLEVIVVNDGSSDGTKQVIEMYCEKYPEMMKAFHIENSGAAQARNVAIEAATGEYIGFVDSDDYVREDTYELLYNKAKEEDADIVSSGYCRVGAQKIKRMSFGNDQIKAEDVFGKNIFEQPLLFDEVPYLWNKIFKADLIRNHNIKFEKDLRIYEDFVFVYQTFVFASKISRVDEHLYNYVVSRDTSLTYRFTEKRFDLLKASRKLIDYYKQNNALTPEIKEALLYVILKHVYVVLNRKTTSVEKGPKRKYCKQIFAFLNQEFPGWKHNYYFKLQGKNRLFFTSKLYWMCCTELGTIPNVKKRIMRYSQKISRKVKTIMHLLFGRYDGYKYNKYREKPIKGKSIFLLSQQGKNLHGSMFYLIKELANNQQYEDYEIHVGVCKESVGKFKTLLKRYDMDRRVKLVVEHKTPFMKALAQAKYLFSDTSLPTYVVKRDEQIYLNTWHGTPLKTLGKATANDFFDIANVQKNFIMADYLLYPNEYMRDIMIRDYMLSGLADNKILMSGYPRNEIFFAKDEEGHKEQWIAYMPTWRGNVRDVSSEQQIEITRNILKDIDQSLSDNQIFFVNMHPYVGAKIDFGEYQRVRKFPTEYETYEFLSICDVLVTDYSSVFFDFAVSKKKIILFVYDKEDYLSERGMYLDLDELPFEKVYTVDVLMRAIDSPNISEVKYNEFLATYCAYDRENISAKICSKVILRKNNDLLIEDMPRSEKKNILVYAGDFASSHATGDFIRKVSSTRAEKWKFYLSYATRDVRPNSEAFKEILPYISYWGQLGKYTGCGRKETFAVGLLRKGKKNYLKKESLLKEIFEKENYRNYPVDSFEGVLIYRCVDVQKTHEFAYHPAKKILYLANANDLNRKVHPLVYCKYDNILVTDAETEHAVRKYCGEKVRVEQIGAVETLNDFTQFFDE